MTFGDRLIRGDFRVVFASWASSCVPDRCAYRPRRSDGGVGCALLDRFLDLHVMNSAQHAVDGALTGDQVKCQNGLALAKVKLERAYAWLEDSLGRTWAAGAEFTMADCAAARCRCSTRTGRTGFPKPFPCCASTARGCLPDHHSPGRKDARPFRPLFPLGAPD